MRLTRKLVLAFLLGMSVILIAYGYLSHRRAVAYFESDVRADVHSLGHTVRTGVTRTWRTNGEAEALRLVEEMNEPGSALRVRWVWLDAPVGDPHYPKAPPEELRRAMATREFVRHEWAKGGEERLVTYFFMEPVKGRVGALEISESLAKEQQFERTNLLGTAVALVVTGVVCGLILMALGFWFVGNPIRKLVAMVRQIGAGDLTARLKLDQQDEIGDLAAETNVMAEKLQTALEQLRHADRLATVGTLASGIAHELGSPLQVLSGRAKMLASGDSSAAEVVSEARIIAHQVDRMAAIIRQLLDFARRRTPKRSALELGHVVRQAASVLDAIAVKRDVTLRLEEAASPLVLSIDGTQLQQVVTNLIMNGIQAMPRGGQITVSLGQARAAPRPDATGALLDSAWIRVDDQGEGINAKDLPHIFEPFFTTKEVGEGTGLGLPVAHGIVREHGGWIAVESEPGRGSSFTVYLPLGDSA